MTKSIAFAVAFAVASALSFATIAPASAGGYYGGSYKTYNTVPYCWKYINYKYVYVPCY